MNKFLTSHALNSVQPGILSGFLADLGSRPLIKLKF